MPPAWVRVLLGKCRPQNLDGRNRMLFSQDGQSHKSGIVMDRSQGHHCNERSIRQHGKQANEEGGQSLELMVTGAFRVRGSDEASSKVYVVHVLHVGGLGTQGSTAIVLG